MNVSLPYPPDSFRVFIFNPETDYALAAGSRTYNPPAVVKRLRSQLAFLPACMGRRGDVVLFLDKEADINRYDPYRKVADAKGVDVVHISDWRAYHGNRMHSDNAIPVFTPWGWNPSLRRELIASGVDSVRLPGEDYIDSLRKLSHRRTTVYFNRQLRDMIGLNYIKSARECSSFDEVVEEVEKNGLSYLKAPWSSSGRGVISTETLSLSRFREWAEGFIRKQGSVMVEKGYKRSGDFASEWWIEDGRARFMGLSMFRTSPEGRYLDNLNLTDNEIEAELSRLSPDWNHDILQAQKATLEAIVADGYSGPVGIDMLTTRDGKLIPCVEINLRFTMGMVELFKGVGS